MIATVPALLLALVVAALLGGALFAVTNAFVPKPVRVTSASSASMFAGLGSSRVVGAVIVGVVVLIASGWVLLALFAAGLVMFWGVLLHDRRADDERDRIEGIAKWLEDLRDTLRGSSVGAEEALEQVAARPPETIAPAMHAFLIRRRQGFRVEAALSDLGDDLAHPTADAAIAAIRLVIGGAAGAGRLHGTVQTLAATARDEVLARERIDRTRAVYQSSMKRLVVIGAVLVGYLKIAGGDLLQPYDSPVGQAVLILPLGLWLGCVLWLRSLCRYDVSRGVRVDTTEAARS